MKIMVEREKLQKASLAFTELKLRHNLLKIICVILIGFIGYQTYQLQTIAHPLVIGTGEFVSHGNGVYEVKKDIEDLNPIDDKELANIQLTEVQLPELPQIK